MSSSESLSSSLSHAFPKPSPSLSAWSGLNTCQQLSSVLRRPSRSGSSLDGGASQRTVAVPDFDPAAAVIVSSPIVVPV